MKGRWQIHVYDLYGIRQIDIHICQLDSLLIENTTYAADLFVVNGKMPMEILQKIKISGLAERKKWVIFDNKKWVFTVYLLRFAHFFLFVHFPTNTVNYLRKELK